MIIDGFLFAIGMALAVLVVILCLCVDFREKPPSMADILRERRLNKK